MIKNIEKTYDRLGNENKIYKVTYNDERISFVPLDPANTDYQAIQEWIAEGNTVIDNGANN